MPVLLISGEADPVTPPENAEMAAKTLPNSLHLIAPQMGHINLYRYCINKSAIDFVNNPSTSDIDLSCLEKIQAMNFFYNYSGPVP